MQEVNHDLCIIFIYLFNDTFNNISVIPWRSVLLVSTENHRPVASQ
jgi:hypothetical protein